MTRQPVFKILVFMSVLALCPLSATADNTIFSEDFESGIGKNWTVFDGNNDRFPWQALKPLTMTLHFISAESPRQ